MSQKIIHNRQFQICAALIAADCLVFTVVNPQKASAVWLIFGFILLGATCLSGASLLAQATKGYGEGAYAASRRFLRYGAVIATALIGLQSIGQLSLKDVVALVLFGFIMYFYLGYGRKLAPERA